MTVQKVFNLHDAGLIERLAGVRVAGVSAFRLMRAVRALRTAAADAIKARYALFDDSNSIATGPGQRQTRDDAPEAVQALLSALAELGEQVVEVPPIQEADLATFEMTAKEAELLLEMMVGIK